jgi:hypothetical protein
VKINFTVNGEEVSVVLHYLRSTHVRAKAKIEEACSDVINEYVCDRGLTGDEINELEIDIDSIEFNED